MGISELAAGEGFEPSHTESESAVLPLHNPAIWLACWCGGPHASARIIIAKELQMSRKKSKIPPKIFPPSSAPCSSTRERLCGGPHSYIFVLVFPSALCYNSQGVNTLTHSSGRASGRQSNFTDSGDTAMDKHHPTIGLPRAMLYYRYRTLWQTFFRELEIPVVTSPLTDRSILEQGTALAIDEACLSLKIYLGHVAALVRKCDYILIPRISSFGHHRNMCTRFEALPDLTQTVFRDSGQKFLTYDVDELSKHSEEAAFLDLGRSVGCPPKAVKRAYQRAKKAELAQHKAEVQAQEALFRQEGLKILIAAHSYVAEDPCMGKPVTDYLRGAGVLPLRADLYPRSGPGAERDV